ncbi:transmembrane protein 198 isoform X2 [Cloeon dipterum]
MPSLASLLNASTTSMPDYDLDAAAAPEVVLPPHLPPLQPDTPAPPPPFEPLIKCHHDFLSLEYDLATAVICGMYLIFGVVYSIFGYRCFKAVMFLTGFIFGSIVVYLICLQETLLPPYGNAAVALSAGLLFGLITMLVQYVGLFMTGFHTGLFLAFIGLAAADPFYRPASAWVTLAILLGGGLTLAVLNLACQKWLTILGTSLYGGAILAGALDYFVEKFFMVYWLWERVALKETEKVPCWFSWVILGIWPFMVTLGLVTQCAVTGRGIYHQEMVPSKHVRNAGQQPRIRTREQRAELRQKKYRYLYQVRTAHGDVISQNYVQALQRKACLPGESSTLQSDATHLTILPADQSQLAALTESEDDSRSMAGLER